LHGGIYCEGEGVGGCDIKVEAAVVDRGHRHWLYHVVEKIYDWDTWFGV